MHIVRISAWTIGHCPTFTGSEHPLEVSFPQQIFPSGQSNDPVHSESSVYVLGQRPPAWMGLDNTAPSAAESIEANAGHFEHTSELLHILFIYKVNPDSIRENM